MHAIGELLRRVASCKRLGAGVEGVEDNGDVGPVARAKASVERR